MNAPSGDRPLTRRVLVLDADLVPALSVARSLRSVGLAVDVASHEARPITSYSRAVGGVLRYPNPLSDTRGFIDWLAGVAARPDYDLIVPVTERTVSALLKHRDEYDDTRVAIAPSKSLRIALEKNRTVELAEALGIPVPRSVHVHEMDDLRRAAERITYPAVIKPVSSVGADRSGAVQLAVGYAFGEAELHAMVEHALRFGEVILQEYFRGEGQGIELIADHGEIRYAFQHRRLHEVPLTGGGSSLRVSEEITPALLEASARLMRAMNWHGVAMVEFKHDAANGEFRLMEVNGRFWGSLPLAAAAGANFPAMLYQLYVEGGIGEHAPPRPGVYCRNLARDVLWHEMVLRRNAPPQIVALPGWKSVARDLLLAVHPRHAFDVQRLTDPRPGLVDLWRIARGYHERAAHQMANYRLLARQRRAWRNGTVQRGVEAARQVLFVCYGNINRSAVADRYARMRLGGTVDITSAGFHDAEDRPADPVMTEIARANGIEMTPWSSRQLTREMVDTADLLFVMEPEHLRRIVAQFPDAAPRVFLLGFADQANRADGLIPDPYGRPRAFYQGVFGQITRCVDTLASYRRTS